MNYYEVNKMHILSRLKQKIKCECGATVNKGNILRHRDTNKHKILLENKQLKNVNLGNNV